MPLRYKFDVLTALKKAGYNTTRLRREKILSEGVIQSLRHDGMISACNIERLCRLLKCQPGDLLEYFDD